MLDPCLPSLIKLIMDKYYVFLLGSPLITNIVMNKQHISNDYFFQCVNTLIISHVDIPSLRWKNGTWHSSTCIGCYNYCVPLGKITAQPWAFVLPSLVWALFGMRKISVVFPTSERSVQCVALEVLSHAHSIVSVINHFLL